MAHAAKAGMKPDSTPPSRMGALDLEAHLRDPARKQAFVTPMFDIIAPRYDDFTRLFSFGMDAGWKRSAIAAAIARTNGDQALRDVLDLATGTGDLAIGIARALPDARVVALDASSRMIEAANVRLETFDRDVARRVHMMVGDMTALSARDASVDLVTAGYAVRNVPSAPIALREMRRVLRPGGRLILLDFYRPAFAPWRALFLAYLQVAGNAVGWWWHRDPVVYGYIARSIDHFMSWQQCSHALEQHGFRVTGVTRYLGGGVARHDAIAV
jgi:demethylmenaquinone methyltransferase/2-methoxy-6-polyprenyl-1,4-benzoquinol methylase